MEDAFAAADLAVAVIGLWGVERAQLEARRAVLASVAAERDAISKNLERARAEAAAAAAASDPAKVVEQLTSLRDGRLRILRDHESGRRAVHAGLQAFDDPFLVGRDRDDVVDRGAHELRNGSTTVAASADDEPDRHRGSDQRRKRHERPPRQIVVEIIVLGRPGIGLPCRGISGHVEYRLR